jgi:hypothetical protein
MDENNMRMAVNLRLQMSTLAGTLFEEGKKDSARKVIERCMEVMPERNVPYDGAMYFVVQTWFSIGGGEKCNVLAKRMFDIYERELMYLYGLKKDVPSRDVAGPARQAASILQSLEQLCEQYKQADLAKDFKTRFDRIAPIAQAIAPMGQGEE